MLVTPKVAVMVVIFQPGERRGLAPDALEVEREDQQTTEEGRGVEQGARGSGGERPVLEQARREHRMGPGALQLDEEDQAREATHEGCEHRRRAPALLTALDERPGQRGQRQRRDQLSREIQMPRVRGRGGQDEARGEEQAEEHPEGR